MSSRSRDTIVARLLDQCSRHSAHAFCIHVAEDRHETITYGDLLQRSSVLANALRAMGARPGKVVLIFEKHRPALYYAFIGSMLAGLVPSFMPYPNPKQHAGLFWQGHRALLERIAPELLLVGPDLVDSFRSNLTQYSHLIVSTADIGQADSGANDLAIADDDIAFLQHSSGTTALKKGVMLSHRAVLDQIDAYSTAIGFCRQDVVVSWLPLYHDMGLIACFMLTMITGATLVALDPFAWVAAPTTLFDAIEQHRGTFCWLPNFAFNHLAMSARRGRSYNLSTMRAFINCSEPCRAESFDAFLQRFADSGATSRQLQVCYAMAENVFAVTQTQVDQDPPRLQVDRAAFEARHIALKGNGPTFLSCGKPVRSVVVRIVDDAGALLPDGYVGEIAIASDFMFSGYQSQPQLTESRLRAGWYYSGDLGFLHEGELYVTGRKDDLLIVYGRNYYAHEIEAVAGKVEDIVPGRCVAFAIPNTMTGTSHAILIAESRGGTDQRRLVRRVREAILADCGLALHQVVLREPGWLVKTTSGKISRELNRARYIASTTEGPPL